MSNFFSKATIVSDDFGAMLSSAKAYFNAYSEKKYKYHQCIVIKTADGGQTVCPVAADSVDELKSEACLDIGGVLENKGNNSVKKIVCMWENGGIDVPSYDLMDKIRGINAENADAEILLNAGADSYVSKQIKDIIF